MTGVPERVSAQLGRPTGRAGQLLVRLLNRVNRDANAEAVDAVDVQPGDRTLDVGFGGGVGLRALLDSPAGSVAGVDPSPDMVARARRRFAEEVRAHRLQVAQGGVPRLPFPDDCFERIITVHTAYFWPEPERAARELRRVLAPGGRVAVVVQHRRGMEGRRVHERFRRLYDEGELEAVLRAAFDDVRVEQRGDRLVAVAG